MGMYVHNNGEIAFECTVLCNDKHSLVLSPRFLGKVPVVLGQLSRHQGVSRYSYPHNPERQGGKSITTILETNWYCTKIGRK